MAIFCVYYVVIHLRGAIPAHLIFKYWSIEMKGKDLFTVIPYQHDYLGQYYTEDLPDNVYLNKTITGSGGTTVCLTNQVNYVVIIPYIDTVEGKCKKHKDVIKVKGGIRSSEVKRQIDLKLDQSHVVKILGTWDSLPKIMKALCGREDQFKICIDEAHNLINKALLKSEVIDYVLNNFRKFKSFIFLTATPNDRSDIPDCLEDVDFLKVDWEKKTKIKVESMQITHGKCNDYVVEICKRHLLGEEEGNAYIFYNSVNEIISVVKKLKNLEGFNADNVNIFCASSSRNDKKIRTQLGARFLGGSFEDCKKINLLTSSTYEGNDIDDPLGKSYAIISNRRDSTKQSGDIMIPQIAGRLRCSKWKHKLVLLVHGFSEYSSLSFDKFMELLTQQQNDALEYLKLYEQQKKIGNPSILDKIINGSLSDKFLLIDSNGDLKFNEYAFKYERQVYKTLHWDYCTSNLNSGENSIDRNENLYRVNNDNLIAVSDTTRLLVDTVVDYKRLMQLYIKALSDNDQTTIDIIEDKSPIHKHHMEVAGKERILSLSCNKTKVSRLVSDLERFDNNYYDIVSRLSLRKGNKYTRKEIKQKLQKVYGDLGIKQTAQANDIEKYFTVRDCYIERVHRGYEIL